MADYRIGIYEKAMPANLSWKQRFEEAKSFGFDWVEMSIDETEQRMARLDWNNEKKNEMKDLMSECNMKIETMCFSALRKYPLGSKDSSVVEKSLELAKKAIDFASDMGIRIIQIPGYDEYYNPSDAETARLFGKNLKPVVEYAAMKGVILGFETMEPDFMNTVEKAMYYVNQINSPYLGIYPDTGNITCGNKIMGTDISKDIECGKGHIFAAHLKETKPGIYRDLNFGEGHVDFEKAIKAYYSIGVRMYNAEFWYKGEENWREICKESYEFFENIFNKI